VATHGPCVHLWSLRIRTHGFLSECLHETDAHKRATYVCASHAQLSDQTAHKGWAGGRPADRAGDGPLLVGICCGDKKGIEGRDTGLASSPPSRPLPTPSNSAHY
jgi:hypothetical protein